MGHRKLEVNGRQVRLIRFVHLSHALLLLFFFIITFFQELFIILNGDQSGCDNSHFNSDQIKDLMHAKVFKKTS
jgi:hypothetical protein